MKTEKLEAKDLMFGDLVYNRKNEICQVAGSSQIFGSSITLDNYSKPNDGTFESAYEVFGIPITAEIMEKIGFRGEGYAILNIDENNYFEYYYFEHRLRKYWNGIDEWQNHSAVKDITFQCHCYYHHELQHAFKLCKFNKKIEIEL